MRIAEIKNGIVTYRNMTAEEETEYLANQQEIQTEPTIEEQVADLAELVGILCEVI